MIAEKSISTIGIETKKNTKEIPHDLILEFRSFTSSFVLILGAVISAFLIQHLGFNFSHPDSPRIWASIVIIGLWLGAGIHFRRQLYWILTSYQFAVSVLATSAAAVILGTFIVQHAKQSEYMHLYGHLLTTLVYSFFLYDLFHSLWFASLLVLTALSLFLVLTKRNPFRPAQLGFLLSHGGIILILAGGISGYFTSKSGMIHLTEGYSSSEFAIVKDGAYTGERQTLGFDLKLEDFQVDYYPAAFKIYAYRKDAEKQEYLAVGSYKLEQGGRYKIPGAEIEFNVGSVTAGDSAAAEIEASGRDGVVNATLTNNVETPLYLNNGEVALIIDKRDQEVKEYRSQVSVYENGTEQRRATIEVNSPLTYKGYSLYQSNYDPENPGYSGIQAIRDPGLGIVYVGFIMMSLGVIFIFYIRPRLVEAARRRQEASHAA